MQTGNCYDQGKIVSSAILRNGDHNCSLQQDSYHNDGITGIMIRTFVLMVERGLGYKQGTVSFLLILRLAKHNTGLGHVCALFREIT
jgi:hypothetical protein